MFFQRKGFSFSFSGYPQRGRGMSSQQDRKALFSLPAGCWDPSQKSLIEKMLKGLAGPPNPQPKLRFFSSLSSPFNDASPVHSLTWLVLHYSLCNTPSLSLALSRSLTLFFVTPAFNWKFHSVAEQGKNWNGQRLLSRFDSQDCLLNYKSMRQGKLHEEKRLYLLSCHPILQLWPTSSQTLRIPLRMTYDHTVEAFLWE